MSEAITKVGPEVTFRFTHTAVEMTPIPRPIYEPGAIQVCNRIEDTLAALGRMLSTYRPEVADDLTITTLLNVASRLDKIEDAWSSAMQIADGERRLRAARDEAETRQDVIAASYPY